MKVVIAGGTGLIGRAVTASLLDAGHEVTVASRSNPVKDPLDPRVQWVFGDVMQPSSLGDALAGADVVVDAVQVPNSPMEDPKKGFTFERIDLGGTINLVDAAKAAGVGRFIGMSGVGAAEHARYHWLRFKWQEEAYTLASGTPSVIFRGSWIYGPRDVALNRFLGFAKFLPFVPVIGDGKSRMNPLFIGDLGEHVAAALIREDLAGQVFEIGGPEVVTMNDVIRAALKAVGKRRFLLHSPVPLMKLAARGAQHMPGRPLTPGAIDFITMDGVADTGPLVAAFGLPLTPLEEGLRSYLSSK